MADYGWRRGNRWVDERGGAFMPTDKHKQRKVLTQAIDGLEAIGAFELVCAEDGCDEQGVAIIAISYGALATAAGVSCIEHLHIACAKAQALGHLIEAPGEITEGSKEVITNG